MKNKRSLSLVVLLFAVSLSNVCLAQHPDSEQTKAAISAFEEGVALFNAGKFTEAVEAFHKANRLRPSWKIKYNIGQCEAALTHYGLAIEAFEGYLAQGGDDITEDRRDTVLAELDRMRKMVGALRIDGQEGIDIYVDKQKRGATPLLSSILLTAGVKHWVWFVKDGKKLDSREVLLRGGETLNLTASETVGPTPLAAVPPETASPDAASDVAVAEPAAPVQEEGTPAGAPPPSTEPATPETTPASAPASPQPSTPPSTPAAGAENTGNTSPRPAPKKGIRPVLFWVGTGAFVAFGGATLGLGVSVNKKWERARKEYRNDPWGFDSSKLDTIRAMQIAGYVTLALGTAGLLTMVISAPMTRFRKQEAQTALSTLRVRPFGSPRDGGIAIEGRF